MEQLRDDYEIRMALEEETTEENEVLKFQIKSLEAEARLERGEDTSYLSMIDELNSSKKSLQRQLANMKRELKLTN